MMSLENDITRLKKEEAGLTKQRGDAQAATDKARAAARQKRDQAARTTSRSLQDSYLREAERQEKHATTCDKKVSEAAKKLSENATKQRDKNRSLENARRAGQRRQDREDERRRQEEKRHAQEVARLARPTVRYIHEVRMVEPPKLERLRVLYLAANPAMNLRVDAEVRQVREAVRKALHRDLVDLDHRPAATPEDLIDGINEHRPHVVHFSGHGGDAAVLFDDGEIHDPQGRDVPFDLLGRVLGATDTPPTLLLLNACDTLDGADELLTAVPVVIGMAAGISDLAAAVFAARFYSAIANGQSVAAALDQGAVGVDLAGLVEGWKPEPLVRGDIDLGKLILVHPPLEA